MKYLPLEIMNYCLYLADTGTKIIYHPLYDYIIQIDEFHYKYNSIHRLMREREIHMKNERIFMEVILPYSVVEDTAEHMITYCMTLLFIIEEDNENDIMILSSKNVEYKKKNQLMIGYHNDSYIY
jgi:hypothetical protein